MRAERMRARLSVLLRARRVSEGWYECARQNARETRRQVGTLGNFLETSANDENVLARSIVKYRRRTNMRHEIQILVIYRCAMYSRIDNVIVSRQHLALIVQSAVLFIRKLRNNFIVVNAPREILLQRVRINNRLAKLRADFAIIKNTRVTLDDWNIPSAQVYT